MRSSKLYFIYCKVHKILYYKHYYALEFNSIKEFSTTNICPLLSFSITKYVMRAKLQKPNFNKVIKIILQKVNSAKLMQNAINIDK